MLAMAGIITQKTTNPSDTFGFFTNVSQKNEDHMKSTTYRESDATLSPAAVRHFQAEESDALSKRLLELIGGDSLLSFSRRCGVNEGTLRNIIKSDAQPRTDHLIAIADAANVSIEWLAAGRGPKQRGAAQPPAPAPAVQLDTRILTRAVTAVQEGLAGLKRPLPPDKHAALIMAAYELILEDEQQAAAAETTSARIVKFIKLAA